MKPFADVGVSLVKRSTTVGGIFPANGALAFIHSAAVLGASLPLRADYKAEATLDED